ncbi:MAG: helix-turn-helix domain-containing protein [Coriobacteriales bacterium]|jgi:endogenous inhibitor of DNA gyrase (YacG/DUF329 family)|nr:helix-turn-helix domain-containing protein [Coriobacteriales bacterium]
MTQLSIKEISRMRAEGLSYAKIASALGASANTIKSICQRNGLGGRTAAPEKDLAVCEQCDLPIVQRPGRKRRRFCSDSCRLAWGKDHPEQISRKAVYTLVCTHCGGSFDSYGNKARKFCFHACYIAHRFEKTTENDA